MTAPSSVSSVARTSRVASFPSGVAMAQSAGDPNSATDQFFVNLVNNSSTLDAQKFTVFGKIVGAADQAVLNALAATTVKDESNGNSSSPFNTIPLKDYTGTNFPTDTKASNYLLVKDVAIVNDAFSA